MKVAPIEIPLTKGFYESESLPVSNRLCKNLYPNIPEIESTSRAQLFSTPGLVQMDTTGINNSNRGAIVMADVPYFVNGNTLWQYDRTIDGLGNEIFTLNNLGAIPGNGRVSIATSGKELCVVVPGTTQAYIYSVSGGFQQITDPAFIPSPIASVVNGVVYASGYFVFHADNGVVFHSQVNDGLSYNSIDFFTYENGKNEVVGLHEHKDQLYVFSDENSSVYAATNVTSNGSAFIKVQGYEFSKGLTSQFAVYDFDGSFVMIGQGVNESPKIYAFTGNDFQPISHSSIEYLLQRYSSTDLSMAFGFNYTLRGGTFAVFSLPNNTFVFDAKVSRLAGELVWHERESIDLADKSRWRVNSLVTAYNRLLCGDSEDGIIGQVDNDTYTEYGNRIFREVSLIVPDSNGVMKRHYYAKLEIEPGISPYEVEFVAGTTNLFLWSSEFTNAVWMKDQVSLFVTPIATKMVESASASGHYILQNTALTPSVNNTFSVEAREGERRYLILRFNGSPDYYAVFDLRAGIVTESLNVTTSIEEADSSGFYRCSATANFGTILGALFVLSVTGTPGSGLPSYTGDGASGLYIRNAQIEEGELTPYVTSTSIKGVREPTPTDQLNNTAEIELTYSDDGKVFEQYRARKCGERGNYFHDLQWLNLGATRTERIYKLRMSHPVKYVLRKFIVGMA